MPCRICVLVQKTEVYKGWALTNLIFLFNFTCLKFRKRGCPKVYENVHRVKSQQSHHHIPSIQAQKQFIKKCQAIHVCTLQVVFSSPQGEATITRWR